MRHAKRLPWRGRGEKFIVQSVLSFCGRLRPGGGIARPEIVFFDVCHEPVVAAFDSTLEESVRLADARSISFRAAAFNALFHARF
jgi:hypothetical protein